VSPKSRRLFIELKSDGAGPQCRFDRPPHPPRSLSLTCPARAGRWQGDKTKALNKNKRAFVKPAKPVRGDQQKLKVGRACRLDARDGAGWATRRSRLTRWLFARFAQASFCRPRRSTSCSTRTMRRSTRRSSPNSRRPFSPTASRALPVAAVTSRCSTKPLPRRRVRAVCQSRARTTACSCASGLRAPPSARATPAEKKGHK